VLTRHPHIETEGAQFVGGRGLHGFRSRPT
jgi:hypothetical protein